MCVRVCLTKAGAPIGCEFSAVGRYLTLHHLQAHDEQYKALVPPLETPEQLEKWRAARRANYPTRQCKSYQCCVRARALSLSLQPMSVVGERTALKRPRTNTKNDDKSTTSTKTKASGRRACRFFAQGKCRRGDSCRYLHNTTTNLTTSTNTTTTSVVNNKRVKFSSSQQRRAPRRKVSLLKKVSHTHTHTHKNAIVE
jgi:hypothetical protein